MKPLYERWSSRIKRWLSNDYLADVLLWFIAGVLIGVFLLAVWYSD